MQTYHIIATPVTLKWNCFSKGQYCGVITHIGTLTGFFFCYSMQINVLALNPSCTNTMKSVVNSDSPVQCFCNPISSKETLKPFFNEYVCYITLCLFIYTLKGQERPQMGCFSRIPRGSCRVQDVVLCCDFSMTDLREEVLHAFHFQFCFCIPYQ